MKTTKERKSKGKEKGVMVAAWTDSGSSDEESESDEVVKLYLMVNLPFDTSSNKSERARDIKHEKLMKLI